MSEQQHDIIDRLRSNQAFAFADPVLLADAVSAIRDLSTELSRLQPGEQDGGDAGGDGVIPEPVQRLLRYAGQTMRTARNPNITAREAIVIGNYLAAVSAPAATVQAERKPDGYAYAYPGPYGGIRFNNGQEVNGCRPVRAVPYFFGSPAATVQAGQLVGDVHNLLEKIDLKAEAGLCQMGHGGTREFLKDIRKLVSDALAANKEQQ